MSTASLGSLPDDLILDIVHYLDTARDVAHFEAASKRTHNLVKQSGWRDFVKDKFASIRLPSDDRCWNKRGVYLTIIDEQPPAWNGIRSRGFMGQSVSFQSVMTATMVSSYPEELFVFGAGEDLVFRRRPTTTETQDKWGRLKGRDMGYTAGSGDVTAMTILERGPTPEIVVGRATGDLQLMSADFKTLGDITQDLLPLDEQTTGLGTQPMRTSPGQMAVSWAEWEPKNQILVSCRSSILTLYNLNNTEEESLRPIMYYDVSKANLSDETSLMRNVKFMTPDIVACGLGGCRQPLRWAQIRPDGLEFFYAAKNGLMAKDMEMGPATGPDEKTTVRAIEPVYGMNPNLLLSAWDDGSHRLSDLRTPSDHDAIYRDRFQPYQASSSMIVYGSERFVTGNNWGPDIRFFDFRYPRPYKHYNALPCSPIPPIPGRPFQKDGLNRTVIPERPVAKCDHVHGQKCTWHEMSAEQSWQPDAVLHMGSPTLDRVHSLTKAADTSSSFYIGFRGSVVEMTLGLAEDIPDEAKKRNAADGWRATQPKGRVSLMETGIGFCSDEAWMEGHTGMPELYYHKQLRFLEETADRRKPNWSRLDTAFRSSRRRQS
ncbi:hypothetical protein PT974_03539 [Cladobotryum mycophilum]|uniref:F-box domain-containing protein n=1 Tax=Cladobotryum mycophilum TaxID=491253 RepID=A0ABR0SSL5_9HYPO